MLLLMSGGVLDLLDLLDLLERLDPLDFWDPLEPGRRRTVDTVSRTAAVAGQQTQSLFN